VAVVLPFAVVSGIEADPAQPRLTSAFPVELPDPVSQRHAAWPLACGVVYGWWTRVRFAVVVGTRTFSFRGDADLAERHDRALAELDRLRRERPRLAESVRYDFDARLAAAQERGLATSADRLRATVCSLVDAVEQALADESLLDREPPQVDDAELAAAVRPRTLSPVALRRRRELSARELVELRGSLAWTFALAD
jgi:hypothetical protein